MTDDQEGRRKLQATVDAYLEERKKFVVGFVRFVLERGLKTPAPQREGKRPETWREAGRRLYGSDLFEATLAAEIDARRQARAESRLPDVRVSKGKNAGEGRAAGGRQDQRGQNHQRPRSTGTAQPSKGTSQTR